MGQALQQSCGKGRPFTHDHDDVEGGQALGHSVLLIQMVAKHRQLDLARQLVPVAEMARRVLVVVNHCAPQSHEASFRLLVSNTIRAGSGCRREGNAEAADPFRVGGRWTLRPLEAQAMLSGEAWPVGLHGEDGAVGLHEDPLGVAAEDEFANLAAVPQADDDERSIRFPGDVEEFIGEVVLVGRLDDLCLDPCRPCPAGGVIQDGAAGHGLIDQSPFWAELTISRSCCRSRASAMPAVRAASPAGVGTNPTTMLILFP